jgi:hypothetical protein
MAMTQGKKFNLNGEDVIINVPAQKRKKVKPDKLPLGSLDEMRGREGGFKPGRLVINFALVDEDEPDTVLTEFDPPFELRIRYTRGDLERARHADKSLELAFWNGSEWVVFTQEKHQFELQPDAKGNAGGYGVALISHWGDPNIAWGH